MIALEARFRGGHSETVDEIRVLDNQVGVDTSMYPAFSQAVHLVLGAVVVVLETVPAAIFESSGGQI